MVASHRDRLLFFGHAPLQLRGGRIVVLQQIARVGVQNADLNVETVLGREGETCLERENSLLEIIVRSLRPFCKVIGLEGVAEISASAVKHAAFVPVTVTAVTGDGTDAEFRPTSKAERFRLSEVRRKGSGLDGREQV